MSHHFSSMLDTAKSMIDNKSVKFVFVGGGPRKQEVVDYKNSHELDNIFIFGYQPMSRLIESLSAADVHFISLQDGFGGMVVPSKVFGVLSVGRPVIFQGNAESEIARMLKEHECGVQVDIDDKHRLQEHLLMYIADADLKRLHGGNAREAYLSQYSSKVGIDRYVELIARLSNKSKTITRATDLSPNK